MTSHLDSHTKILICSKVSKPEMEFHMIDIIYAALPMRAKTGKTTFSCKEDQGKSLHVYQSGGKGLVKNKKRTRPELTQPELCLLITLVA